MSDLATALLASLDDDALDQLAEQLAPRLAGRVEQREADPWIGVEAAAEHLACSRQRIYDLWHQRETTGFPGRKEGSRLLTKRSLLDAWLDENRARR
jgi:hypothetical protein